MINDLYTPQGETVTETPWQVYPRPQFKRNSYLNLNGRWDFAVSTGKRFPQYDKTILVPFCPESLLSGIHAHYGEDTFLYYRRELTLPKDFNRGRVLLHFGAVDQVAEVYLNRRIVGKHTGGYEAFTIDITDYLQPNNVLELRVKDDLRSKVLPYGKQTLKRGGMWYTPVSGIWQTVWAESVPAKHIETLDIQVSLEQAIVTVTPKLTGTVVFEGREVALVDGVAVLRPKRAELWTPENPKLYDFSVVCGDDRVESYFALRTIETKIVDGIPRLCLNGEPYFFHGLLDQGYWPDGLFTPATPECYAQDIQAMKALGFNMLRKHIKVESEQFYYDCDRLGMVVFQDMVNNGKYSFLADTLLPTLGVQKLKDCKRHKSAASRRAFYEGMEATVKQLKNHPSIVYWTIFNEGWGQFCADKAFDKLLELDDSRIIDSTSGWFRRNKSHVESLHIYFGSFGKLKAKEKPLVLSEFGGYCYPVAEHLFCPDKAYGYRNCKSLDVYRTELEALYREKIIPAVGRGLCAAVYTQVTDVEEEINGLLTYDRKVCKPEADNMCHLAKELAKAIRHGQGEPQ